MSGDVQPRKRKDKKRRKDEGEQLPSQINAPLSTNLSNDDVNIHVHKEGGTGGGICAKLVFFVLLSAIVVLIGMIITEYRGQTDVDKVDTESRFSQIFEGWIDASPDHHNEHDIEDDFDDHDLEQDDEDDVEDDEEENELSQEESEPEESNPDEISEENDDEEYQNEDEDQQLDDSDESQLDQDEEDDEIQDEDEELETYEESDEKGHYDVEADDEDDQDHDDDEQELQNINDSDENEDNESIEEGDEISTEKKSEEEDDDDEDKADADDSDEKVPITPKKIKIKDADNDDILSEEKQQESSGSSAAQHETAEDSDSDKQSDEATGYEYANITNKADYKIKDDIDKAQKTVQNNAAFAIKLFDKILQQYPSSPRSIYGRALALDYLADQRRSNDILDKALYFYTQLLDADNVPDPLFEIAAERCIDRMRFVGQYRSVIKIHNKLIKRFPDNPQYTNDLAVTYLTINRVEEARSVLKEVLRKWPNDGFALVHLGFILKTTDNKLPEAVMYLKKGLNTKDKGVIDGRFYFHLGDALARLGRNKEAIEVYEEGVNNNVFLSKHQRSLYNIPRLTGKPWWKLEELPYLDLHRLLTQNWLKIKEEGLTVLNEKGYFQDESENLRESGEWKQFELFARGQKNAYNCKKCPFTCSIIEKIPEARGCKRGQTKFSIIHPGTHVWPHCGPTNCRLRTHLGLKVPPNTFIRVADEIRSWKEGEMFIFDDSFEHEVWHNGTDFRLVLIVDVWHPELTAVEKRNLSPI